MNLALPASPDAFASADWARIALYYEQLAAATLTLETVKGWLEEWSRLDALVSEAGTLAMIAYTGDTAHAENEATYLRFATEIFPRSDEQDVRLNRRLLESGYTRPDLETTLRRFRRDVEIFREANVPLFAEIQELSARYQKVTGGLTVEWDGERKTIPQLQPLLKSTDRDVRERAWRAEAEAYLAKRDELASLFDRMFGLRVRVADQAGFADFEAYSYAAKHRFDYTQTDVARFRETVEHVVVPAVMRLMAYRRSRLGVETLRPWDLDVDLERAEKPLQPFQMIDQFVGGARRIFRRIDAELGDFFDTMADEGLLDLESRRGKAPGGYCATLPFRGRPFVFMNAVGVPNDVRILVHEAGHCFHDFAAHSLPLIWQRSTGSEAAELASMSMELLAAPHLARPVGYYTEEEASAACLDHLGQVLTILPHIASVDAFQSWIYTSGRGNDAAARDEQWLAIRSRFQRGIDWSGLEAERTYHWYRQLHIFQLPCYYIEYGIAQLGALQIWRRSLDDPEGAVRDYKAALALGGTRSLPEIYATAGANLIFDKCEMADLVSLVEREIERLQRPATTA